MEDNATTTEATGLNLLIAPEVHHDEFSETIRNLARSAAIDTVLEIGSSYGEGSTLAWVEGLRQNPRKPRLFCMEVSRVRCEALQTRWGPEGFVECFVGSSVDLDQFPSHEEVADFHRTVAGPLQKYPLEQVLGWLDEDIDYIKKEAVQTGRIREIKRTRGIENFGAVLIDGSEFTGNAELDEVYGAEFILLDDTQTYKCHMAHHRLLHDPGYELIAENPTLRHGYSVFRRRRRTMLDPLPPDAPVHYFTIVLNGQPFIRHHIEVLRQLSFPWHWHIVEGAATLTHDTAWSKATGGQLPDDLHRNGLSMDGTSAYLDDLAKAYPDRITIHRKSGGKLWDGKIEMVAEPLKHIYQDAVLWEIDSDELWTVEQLEEGRRMFLGSPEKSAAYFWCHFFVGERLVVSTRNGYSQNPAHEWLRAWSFRPGMKWLTHEPPVLAERMSDGTWSDIAKGRVFTHAETEAAGLVFQHLAYATEAQVSFKESYYGYRGAVNGWRELQSVSQLPCLLRDALPWVTDGTCVNTVDSLGITPLALRDGSTGSWSFKVHSPSDAGRSASPNIVVDGVFFQLNNTGIGRVWLEVLKQWAASGTGRRIWLLDRDGTAPRLAGINYRTVERYDPDRAGADSIMLQNVCDELHAGVFISTYYTSPVSTPSLVMIHDMIPELLNINHGNWEWRDKDLCILKASRWVCVSHATSADLVRLQRGIPHDRVSVTQSAAAPEFSPPDQSAIHDFRQRHDLAGDYLIVAGERVGIKIGTQGYKNVGLAFKAWSLLPIEERRTLGILCAGGKPELEAELRVLAPDANVRIIRFTDEDLRLAYASAVALVYPSLYEGFGLPVIEAMACGCPVITSHRGGLKEVAGDAAVIVDPWDAKQTATAIQSLRSDTIIRSEFITLGLIRAKQFSFPKMAEQLASLLDEVAREQGHLPQSIESQSWRAFCKQQLVEADLKTSLKIQAAELKETKRLLKQTRKNVAKAEQWLKDERELRRKPLKRLWNRLRAKVTKLGKKSD